MKKRLGILGLVVLVVIVGALVYLQHTEPRRLVAEWFRHNCKDIDRRQTVEWGEARTLDNGDVSVRYMYRAHIHGAPALLCNEVFTFDAHGRFLRVENVKGFPKEG